MFTALCFSVLAAVPSDPPQLTSVAIRVHHMDKMIAFYSEAFKTTFKDVDVGGVICRFGDVNGLTMKLVPLRDSADFENYPSHQLGFEVADLKAVVELAKKYGGRVEGDLLEKDGKLHGAIRDPDGNTIELYQN